MLSACGSSSGGIYTPVHPIAIPPGYQRIGGVGQGMYLAVPKSWTVVDLAAQTPTKAFLTLLQKLPPDNSEITNQVEHGLSVWGRCTRSTRSIWPPRRPHLGSTRRA